PRPGEATAGCGCGRLLDGSTLDARRQRDQLRLQGLALCRACLWRRSTLGIPIKRRLRLIFVVGAAIALTVFFTVVARQSDGPARIVFVAPRNWSVGTDEEMCYFPQLKRVSWPIPFEGGWAAHMVKVRSLCLGPLRLERVVQ